jgi:site-specific DNA-cytosine methylase
VKIRGSYEDAGYGIKVQKDNFPDLDFRDTRADWPKKQDLSRTVILAHPPCAAFSSQNVLTKNRDKQGVDAPKFQCTLDVLEYGMSNHAAAISVESVQPALEGARDVVDAIALEHGYVVYRVLQNARHFNVAQARKRFWLILVRSDLRASRGLELTHKRREVTVAQALAKEPDDEPTTQQKNRVAQARERLSRHLTKKQIDALFVGDWGYGRLCHVIKRHLKLPEPTYTIAKFWVGRAFQSAVPHVLDPDKPAPTLLGDNVWLYRGRALTPSQYKILMGFPTKYKMPAGSQLLYFLSRGVCPPVASWILDQVMSGLGENVPRPKGATFSAVVRPGETIDLQYNDEN